MSQIRSFIGYLMPTYIVLLLLCTIIWWKKSNPIGGSQCDFTDKLAVASFMDHPVYYAAIAAAV